MPDLTGKHELELNIIGDGREFLNFWDWAHGNDVICQITAEGKLMLIIYDEASSELPTKEITFPEFLQLVKDSIASRRV